MKTKTLVIGAVTVTVLLAGGWALAQSVGPPFMHGQGSDEKGGHGPGMMKGMGHGPGMMKGMGPGMMHGPSGDSSATDQSNDQ
jgi:hypothetical protein